MWFSLSFTSVQFIGTHPRREVSNLLRLGNTVVFYLINAGEESLTIFVDKRKLSKRSEGSDTSTNSSSVTLETLHQLAASYFIDRDSTLRRLHHIQIASTAIKVSMNSIIVLSPCLFHFYDVFSGYFLGQVFKWLYLKMCFSFSIAFNYKA